MSGPVTALVERLCEQDVAPSPAMFAAMCLERGIDPAYARAYREGGCNAVGDLALERART